jgi:protein SCO1/2
MALALASNGEPSATGRRLPSFTFHNWDGRPLTNESLMGKTTIVVPTFAKCVFACPMVTFLLAELDKQLGAPADIQYLLVSVNPDADTAEEIRLHFEKHELDPEADARWLFANGPKVAIEQFLAETGVSVTRTRMEEGLLTEHTIRVDVVGPTGEIRKRFDTYFWDSKEMTDALEQSLEHPLVR